VATRPGALGDHGRGGRGHAGQVLGVPDHAADGLPWRRWAVMSPTTRAGVSKSATTSRLPPRSCICGNGAATPRVPHSMRRNSRAATAALAQGASVSRLSARLSSWTTSSSECAPCCASAFQSMRPRYVGPGAWMGRHPRARSARRLAPAWPCRCGDLEGSRLTAMVHGRDVNWMAPGFEVRTPRFSVVCGCF
jgi:hypothetical protein